MLGVGLSTLWRWKKNGRVKFVTVEGCALVTVEELDRLLAGNAAA